MSRATFRRSVRAGAITSGVVALELASARPASADVPGAGIVTNLVGGAAGFAFDKVAEGIARWVLGAVGFFVGGVLDYLRSSVRPDPEAAWFAGPGSPYAGVRNLAGVLLVGFVFLGILQGLLHGDAAGMARRMAGALPASVAGMVVTTAVVARLVELTDAMSNAVLANADGQALHFLSGFGASAVSMGGGFAAVVLGLVAVVAALLLWVELVVRAALVYLLVAISPLGFAAALWPAARGFLRRTAEILLAVIVSKFVICVALAIGVAALSGAGQAGSGQSVAGSVGASIGALLVGAVLLGLAAFSPFLVLKLIPMAEGALLAQGVSRGPVRTAQTGLSTYSSTQMVSRLSGSSTARSHAAPSVDGGQASSLVPGAAASAPAAAAAAGGSASVPAAAAAGGPAAAVATAAPAGGVARATGRADQGSRRTAAVAGDEPGGRPAGGSGDRA